MTAKISYLGIYDYLLGRVKKNTFFKLKKPGMKKKTEHLKESYPRVFQVLKILG